MRELVTALVCGVLFALGLALSGMTNPSNVLAFLDFSGSWDPTLLFVMVGAIAVYAPIYWWRRRRAPHATPISQTTLSIDARLVVGSALFGLGWGLAGYCPGPALTSMGAGAAEASLFAVAMCIGFWLVRRRDVRINFSAAREKPAG